MTPSSHGGTAARRNEARQCLQRAGNQCGFFTDIFENSGDDIGLWSCLFEPVRAEVAEVGEIYLAVAGGPATGSGRKDVDTLMTAELASPELSMVTTR